MTGRLGSAPAMRAVVFAALLGACSDRDPAAAPRLVDLNGETMGTTWHVRYVGRGDIEEIRRVRGVVLAALDEIDRTFSTWNAGSEISRFNADASGAEFAASRDFADLVEVALQLARRTDGAYDPTIRPLLSLFGFTGGSDRRVPSDVEIAAALARVGHAAVRVDRTSTPPRILRDAARELELSSIAKGYGVEVVAARLAAVGHPDHFVEIGGEVQAAGSKPGGAAWMVGIERPPAGLADVDAPRAVQLAVPLRDRAVATSGSYRNFVTVGKVAAHHVLDARTGRNAEHGVVAVSVLAPGCALADALATALLIVGPEPAQALLDAYRAEGQDVAALFLLAAEDGGVVEVPLGWPVPAD